jgi:hypothetical protein
MLTFSLCPEATLVARLSPLLFQPASRVRPCGFSSSHNYSEHTIQVNQEYHSLAAKPTSALARNATVAIVVSEIKDPGSFILWLIECKAFDMSNKPSVDPLLPLTRSQYIDVAHSMV